MRLKQVLIWMIATFLMSAIANAFSLQTVYNPFTGKLDYIRGTNFTGETLYISNFSSGCSLNQILKADANGILICGADAQGNSWIDTKWNISGSYGLDNESEHLVLNWSIINATVDERDDTGGGGGTNYSPQYVNLTAGTYTGDLDNGSNSGYDAGNAICNIEYPGSHLCTEFEVVLWYNNRPYNLSDDAWIIAGGPKYVPADIPVNDCNGFTHGTAGTYLGNYWHFTTTGGEGRALNCGSTFKLACCSY